MDSHRIEAKPAQPSEHKQDHGNSNAGIKSDPLSSSSPSLQLTDNITLCSTTNADLEIGHCDLSGIKVEGYASCHNHGHRAMTHHPRQLPNYQYHYHQNQNRQHEESIHHQHQHQNEYGGGGGHPMNVNNNCHQMYQQHQFHRALPPAPEERHFQHNHQQFHPHSSGAMAMPPRVHNNDFSRHYQQHHPVHTNWQPRHHDISYPTNNFGLHSNQHPPHPHGHAGRSSVPSSYSQGRSQYYPPHPDQYHYHHQSISRNPQPRHLANTHPTNNSFGPHGNQYQNNDITNDTSRPPHGHTDRLSVVGHGQDDSAHCHQASLIAQSQTFHPRTSRHSKMQRVDNVAAVAEKTSNASAGAHAPSSQTLSSKQLQQSIPDFPALRKYQLVGCEIVPNGENVGYMKHFNKDESAVLYGNSGMIRKNMPFAAITVTNGESESKSGKGGKEMSGFRYEKKRVVHCAVPQCPCRAVVCRMQYHDTKCILYYEQRDPETGKPFEHDNHGSHSGDDSNPLSLTWDQKKFIIDWFQTRAVSAAEIEAVMMKMLTDVKCSDEQNDDKEQFIAKVRHYVTNAKRSTKELNHFRDCTVDGVMTSSELCQILDHLKSDKLSPTRSRDFASAPADGVAAFMLSDEGRLCNRSIKVHEHDHDGSNWTYILFEPIYAELLASKATEMYPDKTAQLEMDFFMSVCEGNEWQVGHVGVSDRAHKYWMMDLVIARSENHSAALLLLKRATELLRKFGGDGSKVLVDGGKALAKAIKIVNEDRLKEFEDALAQIREEAEEAMKNDDSHADEYYVDLVKLVKLVELELERCHAHVLRNAFTRGGGKRGGKGSLCRALLDNGCPPKLVNKILGIVYMMSKIPCGEIVVFKNATDLLLEKFGASIKPSVRKSYFNGNPSDLGTHASKRAGEVMSTNGCERRGGETKKAHTNTMGIYTEKIENINPIHMISSTGRDIEFHSKVSDPLAKFAVKPRRDKFEKNALSALRSLSDYKPPKVLPAHSNKKQKIMNLDAMFLYSAVVVNGIEKPHEDVLSKCDISFTWFFPTGSRLVTSLSVQLKSEQESIAGAPFHLQQVIPSGDLKSSWKLFQMLTSLPIHQRQQLKSSLTKNRVADTEEVHENEDVVMYLLRCSHRDADPAALTHDLNKRNDKDMKKTKTKKRKSKQGVKTFDDEVAARLELDKDGGEVSPCHAGGEEAVADEGIGDSNRGEGGYKSDSLVIDGDGGIFEAALAPEGDDENNIVDSERSAGEKLSDRVRLKRELGDWIKTSYDHQSGKVKCNCECFNRHDGCPHVMYVEIIHLGIYPKVSNANELWPRRVEKILHNLKTQCGYLRTQPIQALPTPGTGSTVN